MMPAIVTVTRACRSAGQPSRAALKLAGRHEEEGRDRWRSGMLATARLTGAHLYENRCSYMPTGCQTVLVSR
jgi:hypothetical protein